VKHSAVQWETATCQSGSKGQGVTCDAIQPRNHVIKEKAWRQTG
jgi:hypothetical protein